MPRPISYAVFCLDLGLYFFPTRRSSDLRASIKMIGVSNLQSFIASMTQKLTLSDISDESKNYLDKAGITTACLRIKSKTSSSNSCFIKIIRSEERFSRNAETDLVCRLLLGPRSVLFPYTTLFRSARFDKNDWRIQPAEFYRFHDAEVNTFGYF